MAKKQMTASEMAAHRWKQMTPEERKENIRKATEAARKKRMALPKAKRQEIAKKAVEKRWAEAKRKKAEKENRANK